MGLIYEPTEYIAPDGQVFNFTNVNRFIMSETGYGMPNIKYITQRGPFQHGDTYLGFRLEPRVIQMQFRHNGGNRDRYWTNRQTILNMLRPNRQSLNTFVPGKLRKTFADGSMRDIDVFLLEGPVFEPRDVDRWDEWSFDESIRFIAPDPTFYDPVQKTSTFVYSTANELVFYNSVTGASYPGLRFYNGNWGRTTSGMTFMSGVIDTTATATLVGNWPVLPTITVTGPVNGLVIDNYTTGETIRINYNLITGSVMVIDLRYGAKSVYLQSSGLSLLGSVSTDSDLTSFHLEPAPTASGGINNLHVYAGSVIAGLTAISIGWYDRYIGI